MNVLYLPLASEYSMQSASGAEHSNIRNRYFRVNIKGLKIPTLYTDILHVKQKHLLFTFQCNVSARRPLSCWRFFV